VNNCTKRQDISLEAPKRNRGSTIQIDRQAAAAAKVTLAAIRKFLRDFRVDGRAFFADVVTADELAAGR
jgi:hypothetical protein